MATDLILSQKNENEEKKFFGLPGSILQTNLQV
jgi:hypothetical protein